MQIKNVEIEAPGYEQKASLTIFALGNYREMGLDRKRPLVLVCPGGAYAFLSEKEGEPLAVRFLSMGYHAALLSYTVNSEGKNPKGCYPVALLQLANSVKYIKEHAEEYGVDPDKIIIQGSSAGGHLAGSFGVFWNREFLEDALQVEKGFLRPAGLILNYAVLTSGPKTHRDSIYNLLGERYEELVDEMSLEKQVSKDTPRTFLWHTVPDDLVPVENSMLFAQACIDHGVSVELHLYPVGLHGLALGNHETQNADGYGLVPEVQSWADLVQTWLAHYGNFRN